MGTSKKKGKTLVSQEVIDASDALLKRIDDAVAADPALATRVQAVMAQAEKNIKRAARNKSKSLVSAKVIAASEQLRKETMDAVAEDPALVAEMAMVRNNAEARLFKTRKKRKR